jgi:hypothetical protein
VGHGVVVERAWDLEHDIKFPVDLRVGQCHAFGALTHAFEQQINIRGGDPEVLERRAVDVPGKRGTPDAERPVECVRNQAKPAPAAGRPSRESEVRSARSQAGTARWSADSPTTLWL